MSTYTSPVVGSVRCNGVVCPSIAAACSAVSSIMGRSSVGTAAFYRGPRPSHQWACTPAVHRGALAESTLPVQAGDRVVVGELHDLAADAAGHPEAADVEQ